MFESRKPCDLNILKNIFLKIEEIVFAGDITLLQVDNRDLDSAAQIGS